MLGGLFGLSITNHADIITINGFAMQIINECTALDYVIILSIAIMIYARHSLAYRIKGVLITVLLLVVANAFRLLVTGVVGSVSIKLFDFTHEYLWVALFALLVIALWKVWVDGGMRLDKTTMRRAALIVFSCSAMFCLLTVMLPGYKQFMAFVSSLLFKLLTGDYKAAISWDGHLMRISHAGSSSCATFFLAYMDVALYAGLVLPLQRRGDWETLLISIIGLFASLLINGLFIAGSGIISVRHSKAQADLFVFMGRGAMMALQIGLWWIVSSCASEKRCSNA
jgi:exosortase/archaeosortase family protein